MNARDDRPEQRRMEECYRRLSVDVSWAQTKDGIYHAKFARDAWAAWRTAVHMQPVLVERPAAWRAWKPPEHQMEEGKWVYCEDNIKVNTYKVHTWIPLYLHPSK